MFSHFGSSPFEVIDQEQTGSETAEFAEHSQHNHLGPDQMEVGMVRTALDIHCQACQPLATHSSGYHAMQLRRVYIYIYTDTVCAYEYTYIYIYINSTGMNDYRWISCVAFIPSCQHPNATSMHLDFTTHLQKTCLLRPYKKNQCIFLLELKQNGNKRLGDEMQYTRIPILYS